MDKAKWHFSVLMNSLAMVTEKYTLVKFPIHVDIESIDNGLYDIWNDLNTISTDKTFVCDSVEISNNPEYGDYEIYGDVLRVHGDIIPYIYHKSMNEHQFSHKLTIYDETYSYRLQSDDTYIEIFHTPHSIRNAMLENDDLQMLKKTIINILKSQD